MIWGTTLAPLNIGCQIWKWDLFCSWSHRFGVDHNPFQYILRYHTLSDPVEVGRKSQCTLLPQVESYFLIGLIPTFSSSVKNTSKESVGWFSFDTKKVMFWRLPKKTVGKILLCTVKLRIISATHTRRLRPSYELLCTRPKKVRAPFEQRHIPAERIKGSWNPWRLVERAQ